MLQPQQPPHQTPEQTILLLKILTFAMAFTLVPFAAVLLISQKWVIDQALFNILMTTQPTQILMFVGAILYVARVPVSNMIYKNAAAGIKIDETDKWIKAYFAPHIIRLALAESAGMIGFIIAFQYNESTSFVVLGLAAVIGILREIPSQEKIKERFLLVQSLHTRGKT